MSEVYTDHYERLGRSLYRLRELTEGMGNDIEFEALNAKNHYDAITRMRNDFKRRFVRTLNEERFYACDDVNIDGITVDVCAVQKNNGRVFAYIVQDEENYEKKVEKYLSICNYLYIVGNEELIERARARLSGHRYYNVMGLVVFEPENEIVKKIKKPETSRRIDVGEKAERAIFSTLNKRYVIGNC